MIKYIITTIILTVTNFYKLNNIKYNFNNYRSLELIKMAHTKLSLENILYYLEKYKIKHKEIVLKQIILETGNLKSNVCINKNNLFGLYNGKRYLVFEHWSESILCYKKIQNKYKGNNYYEFLKKYKYSEDKNYINKLKKININNFKK